MGITPDPRIERELWPGELVLWSQSPDPRGLLAARVSYAADRGHEAMLDSVSMSNVAGLVLSPIVGAIAWLRYVGQTEIFFVITTRRLFAVHGAEITWRGVDHFQIPRVLSRKGEIGSVLFPHDTDRRLDMRFDGIRDPDSAVEAALRAIGVEMPRDSQAIN